MAKFKIKLIWWNVLIISIILLLSGCITKGGKKLTGVVPTGHGTYRLQSAVDREKREAAAEAAREKALATQVKLPPVESRPKDTSITPVEPTHVPPVPAVLTPFEPTVSEAELPPLPPLSPSQALIKMGEEESPKATDILLPELETSSVVHLAPESVEKKPAIKIHWGSLVLYYLLAFFLLAGIGYKYRHLFKKKPSPKTKGKKRNAPKGKKRNSKTR